jgi:hypothetical protein
MVSWAGEPGSGVRTRLRDVHVEQPRLLVPGRAWRDFSASANTFTVGFV